MVDFDETITTINNLTDGQIGAFSGMYQAFYLDLTNAYNNFHDRADDVNPNDVIDTFLKQTRQLMDSILFIGKSFNFFKDDADYKNRQRAQACLDFYDSFSNTKKNTKDWFIMVSTVCDSYI